MSNNQLAQKEEKKGITGYLSNPQIQTYLNDVIGKHKDKFITNLVSVVNQNKDLQKCTSMSLMSGAIAATTLNLNLNSSFGYAYLVPFKNNKLSKEKGFDVFEAQFQIGYKGFIQLALRTGEYQKINAIPIYRSQFNGWNALTEEISLNDFDDFDDDEVVGYVAYFRLNNGFEKTIYWSLSKMQKHADTYSQAFSLNIAEQIKQGKISDKDMWRYSSYWYKDFDGMALKTMLRQMLSKWGILSEELQKAIEDDQSVINGDNRVYIDNMNEEEKETKPKDINSLNTPQKQEVNPLQKVKDDYMEQPKATFDIDVDIEVPTSQNVEKTPKEIMIQELINRGASEEQAGKWCYGKEKIIPTFLADPASIDVALEEAVGF